MSQKRARSVSPDTPSLTFRSSSIEDRSSTFIAIYSPTLAAKELQANSEFKSASHRMTAWRKPSNQRSINAPPILDTGHDDDGEKYGGKTLEKLLVETDTEGALVVARWYGGVMLGPVRFDHIKNCARDAIVQWSRDRQSSAKKAKVRSDDEAERIRLIQTLPERDHSMTVLRDLLAEKSRKSSSNPAGMTSPAKKTLEYSALPLATLGKLELVRDATIGWLLEQIEKVEGAQEEGLGAGAADGVTVPRATESPGHCDEHSRTGRGLKTKMLESEDTKISLLEAEDT